VAQEGPADLRCAIQAMAAIGEVCGATAFMAWCQNTLVWYVANSTNLKLAARFGDKFSSGKLLGGTGLSNPMKSFFGIEKLKLKGRKVEGGYLVRGVLPWVSNLGKGHFFGTIFEREDAPGEIVMFLADCSDRAVTLQPCQPFLAMDGTGTYGVQFRDAFVPDELILAEQAGPYVRKIRAGFILLQLGMGLGLIKDCINIMDEVRQLQGAVLRARARGDGAGARPLQWRGQLLAQGDCAAAARGRRQRRGGACGDASLRRARLPEESSRPAPAPRSLFRRHCNARHQATAQDAGRGMKVSDRS
jgi:alkylation response protein AidB-like acyl-CoA dehydrogenase